MSDLNSCVVQHVLFGVTPQNGTRFQEMIPTGIRIIESLYAPYRQRTRFASKGPYFKKRDKKMAKDPRNWKWPDKPFWMLDESTLVCHPFYVASLTKALCKVIVTSGDDELCVI